jgi:heme exporter protein D
MPDLGPHAVFIIAAYGVTAAVLSGLVLWVILGERAQARALKKLEDRGFTRRGWREE